MVMRRVPTPDGVTCNGAMMQMFTLFYMPDALQAALSFWLCGTNWLLDFGACWQQARRGNAGQKKTAGLPRPMI